MYLKGDKMEEITKHIKEFPYHKMAHLQREKVRPLYEWLDKLEVLVRDSSEQKENIRNKGGCLGWVRYQSTKKEP